MTYEEQQRLLATAKLEVDALRIEVVQLRESVGTLAAWLHRELGDAALKSFLEILNKP